MGLVSSYRFIFEQYSFYRMNAYIVYLSKYLKLGWVVPLTEKRKVNMITVMQRSFHNDFNNFMEDLF